MYFKNVTFWSQRFTFFHLKYSFCRPLDSGARGLLSTSATLQVHRLFISLRFFEFFFFHSYIVASIELIPNSKALFEELRVPSNCQEIPTFYKSGKFRTVFKTAHHLHLSSTRSVQSTPSHLTYLKSTLVLSSHLQLGLSAVFCPPIPLRASISSTVFALCIDHLILLDLISRVLFNEEYKS